MPEKEATARININKLLETAGWRFFANGNKSANIRLEPMVALKPNDLDAEHALVVANRELIARFEKKIRSTLARVWGEDDAVLTEARA